MSGHYCGRCKREVPDDEYYSQDDLSRPFGSCGECRQEIQTLGDELTCPCCGAKYSEPWEVLDNDGDEAEVECGSCDATFLASVSVTYTYTGKALKP